MHLPPAEHVIAVFGGVRKAGRALKYQASTVSSWRPKGRCKGRIPSKAMGRILQVARRRQLDITANDLLLGRDVPDLNKKKRA